MVQKGYEELPNAKTRLIVENNATFPDCEEDDDHRVCEEAVAPLNDIDCLVSDQLVCASGSEAIAEKTMEATLGYELSAEMPLSSVESKKGSLPCFLALSFQK